MQSLVFRVFNLLSVSRKLHCIFSQFVGCTSLLMLKLFGTLLQLLEEWSEGNISSHGHRRLQFLGHGESFCDGLSSNHQFFQGDSHHQLLSYISSSVWNLFGLKFFFSFSLDSWTGRRRCWLYSNSLVIVSHTYLVEVDCCLWNGVFQNVRLLNIASYGAFLCASHLLVAIIRSPDLWLSRLRRSFTD